MHFVVGWCYYGVLWYHHMRLLLLLMRWRSNMEWNQIPFYPRRPEMLDAIHAACVALDEVYRFEKFHILVLTAIWAICT